MRDILDPADIWLGTPGGATVFGNKRPVVVDDSLSLLRDSGPVSVAVLANDYDPEGGQLTLISASAALGTAVAELDGRVTYTPPAGLSGFDTVVYEVADTLGQRRSGQIDVTITEPQLSVDVTSGNTLTVTATGMLDVSVSEPAAYSGTYTIDTADLAEGPVNLVLPAISGLLAQGEVLTVRDGLWVYDTGAGTPTRTWQWRRNAADIPGATLASYVVGAADLGQSLSVVEVLTDAFGQRSAASPSLGGGAFTPAADSALIGWWDAGDAASITHVGGAVSAWVDKAGGAALQVPGGGFNPVTQSRTLNGVNVIDFPGDRHLEAFRGLPVTGNVAVHMVTVIDTVRNAFEAVIALEATNDMQIDAGNAVQFDGRLNVAGIGTTTAFSGGPFTGALVLSAVFDRTGAGQAEVFISGISRGAMAYTQPLDTSVALHLMTNRSKNAWIDGAVAELIVTGDVTNRASYHAYLANKWGLL